MEEMDKENRNRHKETIVTLVKQKDTNLAELRRKTSRQAVLYHIPKLCKENKIRVYVKGSGINDKEIFYAFVNHYEYPQSVLELINKMCGENLELASQAHTDFIRLCMEKGSKEEIEKLWKQPPGYTGMPLEPTKIESVRRLAIQLMSNLSPMLKERIAFALTSDHIQYRLQLLNSFI